MSFMPNLDCWIEGSEPKTDRYGKRLGKGKGTRGRCAIVKLIVGSEQTSVRADSSASRGNAQEMVADAVLLFPLTTKVNVDDVVEVAGYRLKVRGKFPRHDVGGRLDHWQVSADVWPE